MTPADRKLFIVAGVIAVLLVGGSLAFGPSVQRESPVPSTYSSASAGALAAYMLLSDLGYDERRWEEPPTGLENLGSAALLILAEPTDSPTKPERDALWRFVSKGGRVLFCGSRIASFFPEHEASEIPAGHAWTEFTPTFPNSVARGVRKVVLQPQAYWGEADLSQLRLFGDQHSAAIVAWRIGEGDLLWWSAATPLTNAGITRADNLKLFLNSVAGAPGESVAIYWDEYFHGQRTGLWGYFEKTPLPWALLQFGLIALGVLFTFSRRSGPVVPAPVVSRLSPLEFVDTMGGLYERAGAASIAVAVPYRHLRFELARGLGMPVGAADADLALAAGERLGLDGAKLAETLQNAATAGEYKVKARQVKSKKALALVQSLEDFSLQLSIPKPLTNVRGSVTEEKT
jgi:hypothetical protein